MWVRGGVSIVFPHAFISHSPHVFIFAVEFLLRASEMGNTHTHTQKRDEDEAARAHTAAAAAHTRAQHDPKAIVDRLLEDIGLVDPRHSADAGTGAGAGAGARATDMHFVGADGGSGAFDDPRGSVSAPFSPSRQTKTTIAPASTLRWLRASLEAELASASSSSSSSSSSALSSTSFHTASPSSRNYAAYGGGGNVAGSPGSSSSRQQTSRDMRLINAALDMDEGIGGGDGDNDDDDALFAVHRRGQLAAAAATHATPPPAGRPHRTPLQHGSGSLHPQRDAAIPLSPSASFPPPSPSSSSLHSVSARQAALDRLRALESSTAASAEGVGGGGALLRVAVAASASPTGRGHFSESPRRSSNRAADASPTLSTMSSSLSSSLRRSFAPPAQSPNVGGSALSSSLVGALRLSTAAAPPLAASMHANRIPPLPPHSAAAHTDATVQSGAMGASPFALRGSLNQSMLAALAASASASAPPRLNSA